MNTSDEEPIPLSEIFGIAGYHTWPFPVDPVFEDYDQAMGFSMPQRLAREQQLLEHKRPEMEDGTTTTTSTGEQVPKCVNDFLPV